MNDMVGSLNPNRRRDGESGVAWRRLGVLWPADVRTARIKISSTVLDISPEGAKLRCGTLLFGYLDKCWLAIDGLALIECTPVWQRNGRVGVRFLSGKPPMTLLQATLECPPYRRVCN
jgi:hypothetical protein